MIYENGKVLIFERNFDPKVSAVIPGSVPDIWISIQVENIINMPKLNILDFLGCHIFFRTQFLQREKMTRKNQCNFHQPIF